MSTGLTIPIIPFNGRAIIESGSKQLLKILMLALADCENTNPFNQDVGMTGDIIFQNSTEALQALIRVRVRRVFAAKTREGRASLVEGFPTFTVNSDTQELVCSIKYKDLETDDIFDFNLPLGPTSGR